MQNNVQFYDIFDYYELPFWQETWFIVLAVVAGIILIALTCYLIFTKKKQAISAWAWATERIAHLSLEKCSTKNDYKRFYFDLTTIMKQYFNKRYGLKTVDKTDEEFTEYLENKGFDESICSALKKMLEGAVWIKFAGEDVIKTQAEADLKTALAIIQKTVPAPDKQERKKQR